jgi:hypothetical protein
MKPKMYHILNTAVEEGVREGWRRAHKHVDQPHEDSFKQHIEDAVMSAIHEYFVFDEDEYQ